MPILLQKLYHNKVEFLPLAYFAPIIEQFEFANYKTIYVCIVLSPWRPVWSTRSCTWPCASVSLSGEKETSICTYMYIFKIWCFQDIFLLWKFSCKKVHVDQIYIRFYYFLRPAVVLINTINGDLQTKVKQFCFLPDLLLNSNFEVHAIYVVSECSVML